MKTSSDYNSTTNQNIKGDFIGKHIFVNVNEMMQHILQSEDKGDYEDEIMNVCSQPNYEDAATYQGWEYNEENEEWTNPESENTYTDLQTLCDDENIDYDYFEAYEFWAVDEFLGRKLKEEGEMVEDIFGLTVWGRCTTGQAILLDYVISQICEDLDILEGQASDWSKR